MDGRAHDEDDSGFYQSNGTDTENNHISTSPKQQMYGKRNKKYPTQNMLSLNNNKSNVEYDFGNDDCNYGYEADDEVDKSFKPVNTLHTSEEDMLFHFCQDNQGTVYTMDRALSIIRSKPKLTKRVFDRNTSDEESEFEIIESAESFSFDNNCSKHCCVLSVPDVSLCVHCRSDEEEFEIVNFHLRSNLKVGKVRSLPSIRFPLYKLDKRKSETKNRKIYNNDDDSFDSSSSCNNVKKDLLVLSSETSENDETTANKAEETSELTNKLDRHGANDSNLIGSKINSELNMKQQNGRFHINSVTEIDTARLSNRLNSYCNSKILDHFCKNTFSNNLTEKKYFKNTFCGNTSSYVKNNDRLYLDGNRTLKV